MLCFLHCILEIRNVFEATTSFLKKRPKSKYESDLVAIIDIIREIILPLKIGRKNIYYFHDFEVYDVQKHYLFHKTQKTTYC